jgi:hypothetical protein
MISVDKASGSIFVGFRRKGRNINKLKKVIA